MPEQVPVAAAGLRQAANTAPAGTRRLSECEAELRAHGLVAGLQKNGAGACSKAGVSMRVPVRHLLDSQHAMQQFVRRARHNLRCGMPLALFFTDLDHGEAAAASLQAVCSRIRSAEIEAGCRDAIIATSIFSHQMPMQAYLLHCTAHLGRGPRYVLLDSLQFQHHSCEQVQSESERNWSFLWQQRMSSDRILPAYAAAVRTPCPLLSDEASGGVLPGYGIQAPDSSAWLRIELPLPRFADAAGALSWPALSRAIACSVESGDRLLDALHWSDPAQRHDARQNRRLAVCVTGIGDLVLRRREDPADLGCLQWLGETIGRVHEELWAGSRQLAAGAAPLPALQQSDPSTRWQDARHRDDWRRRWQKALANVAVRHRNLLVISPYSVLPAHCGNAARYTDLLPVLEHADAFGFADPPSFRHWNIKDFKHFHRRSWAVIQRQKSASFVAAGV